VSEEEQRQAILAHLRREVLRRKKWDQPPELHRLCLDEGRPSLIQVAIPLPLWDGSRPPEVLAFIAHAMWRFGLRAHRGGPLYGMAFLYEGWGVTPEPGPGNEFEQRRVARMSREHTLHVHPQKEEVRCFLAVDRYGTTYTVEHVRGEKRMQRALAMEPGEDPVLTGAVVDALDSMVEQLFGVTLPAREIPEGASEEWKR